MIVSGRLYLRPGSREAFLRESREAMRLARGTPGCRDFVVAADPLEEHRVNVYEEWDSRRDLEKFREDGPSSAQLSAIRSADVTERVVK